MIDTTLNLFEEYITGLEWVERYGGLTKIVQRENDKANYPVSINANFLDCFENGIYAKMVPDDSVKSIVYFQQTSEVRFDEERRGSFVQQIYSGGAKMIVYINLPNLGVESPMSITPFVSDIVRQFDLEIEDNDWKHQVFVSGVDTVDSTRALFSAYKYSNVERLMWYPSLVFSINLNTRAVGQFACDTLFSIKSPVVCKNYAYT